MPMCSLLGCQSGSKTERLIPSDNEWKYVIPNLMIKEESWIAAFIKEAKHITKSCQMSARKYQRELILFKHLQVSSPSVKQSNILSHSVTFTPYESKTLEESQKTNLFSDNSSYRKRMVRQDLQGKLVHICQQIEAQIQNNDHPINVLRRLFMKHFCQKFEEFIPKKDEEIETFEGVPRKDSMTRKFFRKIWNTKEKEPNHNSIQEESKVNSLAQSFIGQTITEQESLYKQAIKYTNSFAIIVKILITKFYLTQLSIEDLKQLQEEFMRISINLVVQQQIFAILLQFCRLESYKMDKDLREKYSFFENKDPQQYKISPYLVLNSNGLIVKEIESLLEKKKTSEIKILIKGHGEQELEPQFKDEIENILKNHECSPEFQFQYMKMIREKLYREPYYRSIRYTQAVFMTTKPPLKKLIELNNLKKIIKDDIIKFWTSLTPYPEEILQNNFNRDEFLTILIYILTKIQVPDLISQFKIMDNYVSKYIKSAGDGCQISETFLMFESSVFWLQALPIDQIQGDELGDSLVKIRENFNSLVGSTPYELKPGEDWDPFHIKNLMGERGRNNPFEPIQNCINTCFDNIFRRRNRTQQQPEIPQDEEWMFAVDHVYPQLQKKNKVWIQNFLRDAETVVPDTLQEAKRIQREFKLFLKTQHIKGSTNYHESYLSSINCDIVQDNDLPITFEVVDQDFSSHFNMVQKDLTEEQCKIYQEIEHQVSQDKHPVSHYCQLFEDHFVNQYSRYVADLKGGKHDHSTLFRQLADENRELQANHIQRIIENESMDEEDKEAELLRKDEITVFTHAMREVKDFTFAIRTVIFKFYIAYLKKSDLSSLVEDLLRLSINKVLTYQVYKILLCLCRVETFAEDKDIRYKYSVLGRLSPEEFGIDPYLTLNSQSPIVDEIIKTIQMQNQQSSDSITIEEKSITDISKDFSTIERDQNKYIESYFKDMNFISMDEDFKRKISDDIRGKLKNKPYRECVVKFRQIMLEHQSPMMKLLGLQALKEQIKKEIIKFWDGFGAQGKDIVGQKFSRDEYISIFIFIMAKAQVPDLVSQLRIISCFTSPYVQESCDGSITSETYNMVETCIKWFQGLQVGKLGEEGYLLKATIQIREKLSTQGYQYIEKLSESFDPFQITQYGGSFTGRGSYFIKQ